jgi:RND family efflux transporter MFP subunit
LETKKKKAIILAIVVTIVFASIIGYRIYSNLAASKQRAGRISEGRGVAVQVGTVVRKDIIPMMSFSANLEPVWIADISSKVDGRMDTLLVNEGDAVETGGLIATLDTNELAAQVLQAEGNWFSAQAGLEQAQLDLQRTEPLAQQGALSIQALDTARIKRDLAVGQLRSAEGNLAMLRARLDYAKIISPRNGIVTKRYLQSGSYTKVGSPIVSIADVSSMLAKATVGEGQIAEMHVGSLVKVIISALGDKQFDGTITLLSPAAAIPARTFTAEVTIPNGSNELKSGLFAKVVIPGQVHKNVICVPEIALVMREDQKTVYVVTADNKVQQRVLKLGYVGDGFAEVMEGIQEGERIVIAGQNKLKDGSMITTTGEGEK